MSRSQECAFASSRLMDCCDSGRTGIRTVRVVGSSPAERCGSIVADANEFKQRIIEEFRANGGNVGGMFPNSPMLLLTTTGAKSGEARTMPLVYTTDEQQIIVIASNGGSDRHPAWYHNIRANPLVTIEVGTERFQARAEVATGDERTRLIAQQAALIPGFAEYQRNTTREIPAVVLERTG